MWRGLSELGTVEKYATALNLGMIGALLVALAVYNIKLLVGGNWELAAISSVIDFHDLRVLLGLLIVVQGFETSRYLGSEYPAEQRIATMRAAQLLSATIYVLFIWPDNRAFSQGYGRRRYGHHRNDNARSRCSSHPSHYCGAWQSIQRRGG